VTIFDPSYNYFIIGHRGVGKTTFLSQIQNHLPHFFCWDLDHKIEQDQQKTIPALFSSQGETHFRSLEQETLKKMLRQVADLPHIVSLGAGFELDQFAFPPRSRFIMLARKTDQRGRILLDRPLWNSSTPPLEQYKDKYKQRDPLFHRYCDFYWELPEGFEYLDLWSCLTFSPHKKNSVVTFMPWHGEKSERILFLLSSELIEFIEIRTDLIDLETFKKLENSYQISQHKKILLSARLPSAQIHHKNLSKEKKNLALLMEKFSHLCSQKPYYDYDTEFLDFNIPESYEEHQSLSQNKSPLQSPAIPSHTHTHTQPHTQSPAPLVSPSNSRYHFPSSYFILSSHNQKPPDPQNHCYQYLKWSPLLSHFSQWDKAMEWQQQNPSQHILAPRVDPSWQNPSSSEWMRLLLYQKQNLHYLRTDKEGSYPGQPHYISWLCSTSSTNTNLSGFYAVIGNPVDHSHSPCFHHKWVQKKSSSFLKIPVKKEEVSPVQPLFIKYGLKGLAITSPLKKSFSTDLNCKPINTFKVTPSGEKNTYNTDILGIALIYEMIKESGFHYLNSLSLNQLVEYLHSKILEKFSSVRSLKNGEISLENLGTSLKNYQELFTNSQSFLKNSERYSLHSQEPSVLILGGGGLLDSLQKVLPHSFHIPSRSQELFPSYFPTSFDYLLWAAPPDTPFRLPFLRVSSVWDLNYHEHSLARELAQTKGLPYLSGRSLFIAQGFAQQIFWD
jgi:shikimate kinase